MIYVCLWSPVWATGEAPLAELAGSLLTLAPRVAVDGRGVIWADARGLPARELALELVARAGGEKDGVRAGVSAVPVAAELVARAGASVIPASPPVIPAKAGIHAGGDLQSMDPRLRGDDGGDGGPGTMDPRLRGDEGDDGGDGGGVAGGGPVVAVVPPGRERPTIAPLPLDLLSHDPRLLVLLEGVGVRTCGELAALSREAVEVRFGAEAGALWRLARADDRRILFRPIPRERPQASMDFVEYEVREAGRLVFTANALLGSVCGALLSRAERARSISLSLTLSSGGVKRERIRSSRPTADRDFWLRRLQGRLDRLRLPEPVVSVSLEVDETEPRSSTQGDLFDRGFATAGAVEEAVARLLDEQGQVLVEPERDGHPLAERRTRWIARAAASAAGYSEPGLRQAGRAHRRTRRSARYRDAPVSDSSSGSGAPDHPGSNENPAGPRLLSSDAPAPALTLHLLRAPRALGVKIAFRGVQILPASFLYSGEWQEVALAAGPDRVSGGRWDEAPFARDYFRCVTGDGRLVWIFRDLEENRWYLHGWWE